MKDPCRSPTPPRSWYGLCRRDQLVLGCRPSPNLPDVVGCLHPYLCLWLLCVSSSDRVVSEYFSDGGHTVLSMSPRPSSSSSGSLELRGLWKDSAASVSHPIRSSVPLCTHILPLSCSYSYARQVPTHQGSSVLVQTPRFHDEEPDVRAVALP